MQQNANTTTAALPFGRHKGRPLAEVPGSYLLWCLRECKLSSGLRAAVAGELARRGVEAPAPPEPRPVPPCRYCGGERFVCRWQEDRRGGRRVRAECAACGRWMTYLPLARPFTDEADAAASPTAVLDALVQLGELGVELRSDGKCVWFAAGDHRRVPADLHALVRQCGHQLSRLLGDTEGAGAFQG